MTFTDWATALTAMSLVVVFLAARAVIRQARRSARRVGRHVERRLVDAVLAGVGFRWWTRRQPRRRPAPAVHHHSPARPPSGDDGPTWLYRHWSGPDCTGQLIYIGITRCRRGGQRWEEHAADKWWFPQVRSSRVELHSSWAEALYAEALAIRDENPVHNIARPDPARIGRHKP